MRIFFAGWIILAVMLGACVSVRTPDSRPPSEGITVLSTQVPSMASFNPNDNLTYWFSLEPIADIHMGETIMINGTTNLPVETKISFLIDQGTPRRCLKSGCTHHDEIIGEIYPKKGTAGVNYTLITANTSSFVPDRYFVLMAYQFPHFYTEGNFTILPPMNATAPPIAWFFLGSHCDNKTYCAADFLDHSLHYPTSWNWSFGDGNFSTESRPSHVYLHDGVYQVRLTVSNSMGSDTSEMSVCWPVAHWDSQGEFADGCSPFSNTIP